MMTQIYLYICCFGAKSSMFLSPLLSSVISSNCSGPPNETALHYTTCPLKTEVRPISPFCFLSLRHSLPQIDQSFIFKISSLQIQLFPKDKFMKQMFRDCSSFNVMTGRNKTYCTNLPFGMNDFEWI